MVWGFLRGPYERSPDYFFVVIVAGLVGPVFTVGLGLVGPGFVDAGVGVGADVTGLEAGFLAKVVTVVLNFSTAR